MSKLIEIQEGLLLEQYTKVIAGKEYIFRKLQAKEGYHFYNTQQPENYDDEGNLLPAEQRVYSQEATLANSQTNWTYEQINKQFVSIPIVKEYEIK